MIEQKKLISKQVIKKELLLYIYTGIDHWNPDVIDFYLPIIFYFRCNEITCRRGGHFVFDSSIEAK